MIIIVLLSIITIAYVYLTPANMASIQDIIDTVHPYSGVDPESYKKFVDYIHLFRLNITNIHEATKYLQDAIVQLNNIQFVLNSSSSGYDIHQIIDNVKYECDNILSQEASILGISYIPTHLNDKQPM